MIFKDDISKSDYPIYLLTFVLAVSAILLAITGYFMGNLVAYPGSTSYNLSSLPLVFDSFTQGAFEQRMLVDNLVITERYIGQFLNIAKWPAMVLQIGFALSWAVILAVGSRLKRTMFLVINGFYIIYLGLMPFNQLKVFGLGQGFMVGISAMLAVGIGFFYNTKRVNAGLLERLSAFLLFKAMLLWACYYDSTAAESFQLLSSFGTVSIIFFVFLFIMITGYDIQAGVYTLITDNRSQGNNANINLNFIIFNILYLGNLLFGYLKQRGSVDFISVTISPWIVLLVSYVVGLWQFRKRAEQRFTWLEFGKAGAFIYQAITIMGFLGLSYFFFLANDPMIAMLESAVYLGYLCFGFIFFLYILVNFSDIVGSGRKVHRVMYEPRNMPVLMLYAGGITGVFIFVQYANRIQYLQSVSGYYNNLGDLFYQRKEFTTAEQFYNQAGLYQFQNHHSNYAMGCIAIANNEEDKAKNSFYEAKRQKAIPETFLVMATHFQTTDRGMEALQVLREGFQKYPSNTKIINNLALDYAKIGLIDTALFYINLAEQEAIWDKEIITANKEAILIQAGKFEKEPSKEDLNNLRPTSAVNRLAISNTAKRAENLAKLEALLPDSNLNVVQMALLHNAVVNDGMNQENSGDTVMKAKVAKYMSFASNGAYSDNLHFLQALSYLKAERPDQALLTINSLADNAAENKAIYQQAAAVLNMKYRAWHNAVTYAGMADDNRHPDARFTKLLALSALPGIASTQAWLQESVDSLSIIPKDITFLAVSLSQSEIYAFSDADKFKYITLKVGGNDFGLYTNIINSMQNAEIKLKAGLFIANEILHSPNALLGIQLAEILDRSKAPDVLKAKVNETMLYAYCASANINAVKGRLSGNLKGVSKGTIYLAKALVAATGGDSVSATQLFVKAIQNNPNDVLTLENMVSYFNEGINKKTLAYDLLVEAYGINAYNLAIQKRYIEQCYMLNLDFFAKGVLERLQQQLSEAEFNTFTAGLKSQSNS